MCPSQIQGATWVLALPRWSWKVVLGSWIPSQRLGWVTPTLGWVTVGCQHPKKLLRDERSGRKESLGFGFATGFCGWARQRQTRGSQKSDLG